MLRFVDESNGDDNMNDLFEDDNDVEIPEYNVEDGNR